MHPETAIGQCAPDLLKVVFFARSEFSLIKFCAELCTEIAKKNCKICKNLVKLCQKYEKCLFCKVRVQKFKFCADSRKFCADMRLRVRAF